MGWLLGGMIGLGALGGILGGSGGSKAPPYKPVPKDPLFTAKMPSPSGVFSDLAAKPSGLKPEDYLTYGQVGGKPSAAFFDYVKTPAQQQAAKVNWQDYLTANPDVLEGYKIGLARKDPLIEKNGLTDPLKYAQWHYQTYGQGEGRRPPNNFGGVSDWSTTDIPGMLESRGYDSAHPGSDLAVAAPPADFTVQMARGGSLAVKGPGTGRSDSVPAQLSNGEYVVDAESVAMLGDGSNDAGASKLDDMRVNLRKHKGAALKKGKFSPNAKAPQDYMVKRKGGKK